MNQEKTQVLVWLNRGTALYLRGLAQELDLVNTTGRSTGKASISQLLERIVARIEDGSLDSQILTVGVVDEDQHLT